jgi:anti-sigma regulatory factor (Ser/Thr protein kinase)
MALPQRVSERRDLDQVVYERLLPAVPENISRLRTEFQAVLARHGLAADRAPDIGLVVSEAATNAVLHAYRAASPGPLYASATIRGHALTISICDCGPGIRERSDSPGLGLGIALMEKLCDELRVRSKPPHGTCVHATFEAATTGSPDLPREGNRAQMYREYLRHLEAVRGALADDTQAAIAQARQTVAHARRGRRERQGDVRRTMLTSRG